MPRKNTSPTKQTQSRSLERGEKLHYTKTMIKKRGRMYWRVIEKPTNVIVKDFFFEKDARSLVRFQNKERVWEVNGGNLTFFVN
tara:strand:- start:1900 stop:2151 length:252 start_codon:yes stop_codon:yes gene_type:complete